MSTVRSQGIGCQYDDWRLNWSTKSECVVILVGSKTYTSKYLEKKKHFIPSLLAQDIPAPIPTIERWVEDPNWDVWAAHAFPSFTRHNFWLIGAHFRQGCRVRSHAGGHQKSGISTHASATITTILRVEQWLIDLIWNKEAVLCILSTYIYMMAPKRTWLSEFISEESFTKSRPQSHAVSSTLISPTTVRMDTAHLTIALVVVVRVRSPWSLVAFAPPVDCYQPPSVANSKALCPTFLPDKTTIVKAQTFRRDSLKLKKSK